MGNLTYVSHEYSSNFKLQCLIFAKPIDFLCPFNFQSSLPWVPFSFNNQCLPLNSSINPHISFTQLHDSIIKQSSLSLSLPHSLTNYTLCTKSPSIGNLQSKASNQWQCPPNFFFNKSPKLPTYRYYYILIYSTQSHLFFSLFFFFFDQQKKIFIDEPKPSTNY